MINIDGIIRILIIEHEKNSDVDLNDDADSVIS